MIMDKYKSKLCYKCKRRPPVRVNQIWIKTQGYAWVDLCHFCDLELEKRTKKKEITDKKKDRELRDFQFKKGRD